MKTETRAGLPILAFRDSDEFDGWLAAQAADCAGLWLKLAKQGARKISLSKAEAIDVALCHGWIDGQLNPYDDTAWLIRFTPRKRASRWSKLNCSRAEALLAQGRLRAAGLTQVEAAKADGRWGNAYAPASKIEVPDDLRAALDANAAAQAFFATLTGVNRYAVLYRIGAVKKATTRARKIEDFVAMLERGETIHG
jgi:uncharacterized protein YdeI (YjbR/CyaY-like superfamily)